MNSEDFLLRQAQLGGVTGLPDGGPGPGLGEEYHMGPTNLGGCLLSSPEAGVKPPGALGRGFSKEAVNDLCSCLPLHPAPCQQLTVGLRVWVQR